MDYKGHLCPVCNKAFEKGDDVVVCPVCGTPHHRDCYDELGHCFNLNRHRENYDYGRECEVNEEYSEDVVCAFCGAKNPADSKYCNACGKAVGGNYDASHNSQPHVDNSSYPQGGFGTPFVMDPLGGVNPDEDLGSGVKAGEAAKFVKATTPYFIPQFKQLKDRGRTRFSFVGFIFSGGWMLYRKMYKLGAVFTALLALLTFADLYISVCHKEAVETIGKLYNEMLTNMTANYGFNVYGALGDFFVSLSAEELAICIASVVISFLMILIRVLCGIFGNRWYYKHTVKTVSKIKNSSATPHEADTTLNTKGGVNIPLAISLIASYYIILYLPMFL